jgi:hypothetical protein
MTMKTYPIRDESGYPFAVEVDMVYCGLRNLLRVIASSEGVSGAAIGKGRTGGADVRANFRYQGDDYVVTEPFGDNSRYWIGPGERNVRRDISAIEGRLKDLQPSALRRIVGGLVSLDFAALLGR